VTFVGSGWGLRKKEVDAIGHIVESGSKAQLDLGITVSYISPPPPDSCLAFGNKSRNPRGNSRPRSSSGGYWAVEKLINVPSKGMLRLSVGLAVIII